MDEQNKTKSENALREEKVLEFWRENKTFEKSLEKKSPKGEFIFYEGPPTANAKPGIHHLEARAFKDAIPRYKTMRGYHVRRKGGWDTHGLPVELQVEKKLGFKSKVDIEAYGIAKFNQECKENVWEQIDLDATLALYVGLFDSSATMRTLSCAQPRWIEIPVGFTIIRQARHVPVVDQWRIGFPN